MQKLFTLGVEEEFQIVDPQTRDLRPEIERMLATGGEQVITDSIRREMMQLMIETVAPICADLEQVRRELTQLRAGVSDLARKNNLAVVAAGAHPFSLWQSQAITR